MKALSLSQPWLWPIELYAQDLEGKGIENRTWAPPIADIGTRIALHAAKSWDDDATRFIFKKLAHRPDIVARMPGARRSYAVSAITCTVAIDRVVTVDRTLPDEQKGWFFGPYGWVLSNVIVLPEPVPCGGRQGLWRVPDEIAAAIARQEGV